MKNKLGSKDDLLAGLLSIAAREFADEDTVPELDHLEADLLLLEYINDERVTRAFKKIRRSMT